MNYIEKGGNIMSIMIFNNFIPQVRQDNLYKYIKEHDFRLEDAFILIDNKTKVSHVFLSPFSSKIENQLYETMKELRK